MERALHKKIEIAKEHLDEGAGLYFHRIGAVFDIAHDLEPTGLPLEEIPEEDREFYVSARELKRLLSYYQLKDLSLEDILSFKADEADDDTAEAGLAVERTPAYSYETGGGFDPVEIFQQEVSKYPPLSDEEEAELTGNIIATKRSLKKVVRETCKKCSIKAGRMQYYEDIKEAVKGIEGKYLDSKVKSSKRARLLRQKIKEIKELDTEYYFLRQEMTRHNLRLVFFLAKKYIDRELPILDLIQEGNIGLMKAVDRYQPARGSFSTYAGWYIEGHIKRSLAQHARTVRLPVHVISSIKKLYDIYEELVQEHQREPTYKELAERVLLPLRKVRSILESGQPAVSLHSKIEGEEGELGDYLEDGRALSPAEASLQNVLREQLGQAVFVLTGREREVIKLRFGIGDDCPRTLEEIGKVVGLTRERVRQIEKEALKKLAESEDIKPLKDFIG